MDEHCNDLFNINEYCNDSFDMDEIMNDGIHTCSFCRKTGHYIQTCPATKINRSDQNPNPLNLVLEKNSYKLDDNTLQVSL